MPYLKLDFIIRNGCGGKKLVPGLIYILARLLRSKMLYLLDKSFIADINASKHRDALGMSP